MVFRTLTEQNFIIEQMLDPTLFQNQSNFPIAWDNAMPVTWAEIEENDPESIEKYGRSNNP